jgi:hypothetical protein
MRSCGLRMRFYKVRDADIRYWPLIFMRAASVPQLWFSRASDNLSKILLNYSITVLDFDSCQSSMFLSQINTTYKTLILSLKSRGV